MKESLENRWDNPAEAPRSLIGPSGIGSGGGLFRASIKHTPWGRTDRPHSRQQSAQAQTRLSQQVCPSKRTSPHPGIAPHQTTSPGADLALADTTLQPVARFCRTCKPLRAPFSRPRFWKPSAGASLSTAHTKHWQYGASKMLVFGEPFFWRAGVLESGGSGEPGFWRAGHLAIRAFEPQAPGIGRLG